MKILAVFVSLISLLITSLAALPAAACTAFAYTTSTGDPFVAKNLDWYWGHGLIFINKRGVTKDGLRFDGVAAPRWTSKFASLTLSQTGLEFPWEGLNEKGLSIHILQLSTTIPETEVDSRPAIDQTQFIQYLLDTAADVREAIIQAQAVRIRAPLLVHYMLCDAGGACAVIESIDGHVRIQTGPSLPVHALANNTFEDSLNYSLKLSRTTPESVILANRSNLSLDRFARAARWSKNHPDSPIEYGMNALANLAEVFPTWRTYWSFVANLRERSISISTLAAPSIKSVVLADFNLDCSSGVELLDVNTNSTVTPLSHAFVRYTDEANRELVSRDGHLSFKEKKVFADYPAQYTHCLN